MPRRAKKQHKRLSRPSSKRNETKLQEFRTQTVFWADTLGSYAAAADVMGVSRQYVRYWYEKAYNPNFHPLTCGGLRHSIFSTTELPLVRTFLWDAIAILGDQATLGSLSILTSHTFQRIVTTEVLSRLFTSFRWSWRIPSRMQILKYTQDNLQRYYDFILWIQEQDWQKIKFADESHVVSKDLRTKKSFRTCEPANLGVKQHVAVQSFIGYTNDTIPKCHESCSCKYARRE